MKKFIFLPLLLFCVLHITDILSIQCYERDGKDKDTTITVFTYDLTKDLDIFIAHPQFCGKKTKEIDKPNYVCQSAEIKAGKEMGSDKNRKPLSLVRFDTDSSREPEIIGKSYYGNVQYTQDVGLKDHTQTFPMTADWLGRSYEIYVWDKTAQKMYVRKNVKRYCWLNFPEDFEKVSK